MFLRYLRLFSFYLAYAVSSTLLPPLQAAPIEYKFVHHFSKKGVKCKSTYTIGADLPITIKRVYASGRKEWIILKPIQLKDDKALHSLIKSNPNIKKFLGRLYNSYSRSLTSARTTLKEELYANKRKGGKKPLMGIFFRTDRNSKWILVGLVGFHSYGYYRPGGYDGFYAKGNITVEGKDKKPVKVEGIITLALQAYLNFFIANTNIRYLNLAIRPDNINSLAVAKKLPSKRLRKNDYRRWGYEEKKDELLVYHISRAAWMKRFWKGKQP